jgi:hypothetical protein
LPEVTRKDISSLLNKVVIHVTTCGISNANEPIALFCYTETLHPSGKGCIFLLLLPSSVELFLVPYWVT